LTDVSEVLAASIIRAISDLDDVSSMDLWNVGQFLWLHGATFQKTVAFIIVDVRTWNIVSHNTIKYAIFWAEF
jgi:hypothetical protein